MEEELEKLYQDLLTNRQTYRGQGLLQVSPPQPYQNLIDNPTAINYDFTSLYPSAMSMNFLGPKNLKRKKRIRNIFQ
jgi:DNA polymerase elongation subunit (family B)